MHWKIFEYFCSQFEVLFERSLELESRILCGISNKTNPSDYLSNILC